MIPGAKQGDLLLFKPAGSYWLVSPDGQTLLYYPTLSSTGTIQNPANWEIAMRQRDCAICNTPVVVVGSTPRTSGYDYDMAICRACLHPYSAQGPYWAQLATLGLCGPEGMYLIDDSALNPLGVAAYVHKKGRVPAGRLEYTCPTCDKRNDVGAPCCWWCGAKEPVNGLVHSTGPT